MPKTVNIAKMTNPKEHPYTNMVYMHPSDMAELGLKEESLVLIDEVLVHRVGFVHFFF